VKTVWLAAVALLVREMTPEIPFRSRCRDKILDNPGVVSDA